MVNDKVKREIANLSSGTMGTLIDRVHYDEIDESQDRFLKFAMKSPKVYNSWVEAWDDFLKTQKPTIAHY